MPFTTLIDSATLENELGTDRLVIVDCRFDLADPDRGRREYASRHIPGAIYADLDKDLSGTKTGTNGRHPLPEPGVLARTFGKLGIDETIQVVAYDQDSGMVASRLWWELRWLGHDKVAVLDGGFSRWLAEGRRTSSEVPVTHARAFAPRPRSAMVATLDDVAAALRDGNWTLVDARAPARFNGTVETLDRAAGHIPGAVNHFFQTNLSDAGTFRSADELRERLQDALGDTPADRIISYCGSGVTACQNLLAMEHAGLRGARLYPGSWSEWSADPARPIERQK